MLTSKVHTIVFILLSIAQLLSAIICRSDQFRCRNGGCITGSYQCDGDNDCFDNSDEDGCNIRCSSGQFSCSNGKCISNSWRCDSTNDCGDSSDEKGCNARICGFNQFRCRNSRCITRSYQCDGDNDCYDNSDEDDCTGRSSLATTVIIPIVVGVGVSFIAMIVCIIRRKRLRAEQARRPVVAVVPNAGQVVPGSVQSPNYSMSLRYDNRNGVMNMGFQSEGNRVPPSSANLPPKYDDLFPETSPSGSPTPQYDPPPGSPTPQYDPPSGSSTPQYDPLSGSPTPQYDPPSGSPTPQYDPPSGSPTPQYDLPSGSHTRQDDLSNVEILSGEMPACIN